MDTIVMKYISGYIIDRWNLDASSSRRGGGQKRVPNDVLNLPKFESWWGCSDVPSEHR